MAKSRRTKSSEEEAPPRKVVPARKRKPPVKHETPAQKKKPPLNKKPQPKPKPGPPLPVATGPTAWRKTVVASSVENSLVEKALVPYSIDTKKTKKAWPSALFFNATYPTGILYDKKDNGEYFAATEGYDDYDDEAEGIRTRPYLSEEESKLWCHKHAAHTAVARRFPVEVGRMLGTITLEIQETPKGKGKAKTDASLEVPALVRDLEQKHRVKAAAAMVPKYYQKLQQKRDPKAVRRITHKHASDEANTEMLQTPDATLEAGARLARVHEIQDQWKAIQNCDPMDEPWDKNDGSLPAGKDDDHHATLRALQEWLAKGIKAGTLADLNLDRTKELYGGLTTVHIDASDILQALVNLASPGDSLYGVPLVSAYPRMERIAGKKNNQATVWKIQLGVYMHRLLPEIFCCQSLHIVMSALDKGTFQITQPLRLPPSGPKVFESSPYPKVDTSVLEEGSYEKKNKKKKAEIIDVDDMEGGSRDEMVISPFSVKGLLKLLENKGCDVSNWPQIERDLQGKFQLDLLLHQQHAICWMMQMEHLKGAYGINSLLWEQRTFPDGGHFYYSPALGQVRLGAPPPHMKGGLLCDEQGLGKTVEVLGLIMATLSELKEQVQKRTELKKKGRYEGDSSTPLASDDDDDDEEEEEYITHTTLIIVPPALVGQWLHEIEKAVGKTTLTVSFMVAKSGELKKCLPPPTVEAGGGKSDDDDDWEIVKTADIIVTTYDALDSKNKALRKLSDVEWGRVVLDEMQEVRSATTQIAKNCESLQCDRRWMLSGTPIFGGIEDLRGELNFLRLEPFAAGLDDGFFDFAVQKPWEDKDPRAVATLQILCLIALRRSKDMTIKASGTGLLDLKPMTVEYIPVPQTVSERAIYCWMEYIVASELELTKDNKNNKLSKKTETGSIRAVEKAEAKSHSMCLRLLRELCITPVLINGGMGAASQLEAVNRLMIRHNRREMEAGVGKDTDEDSDDDEGRAVAHHGGRDSTTPVMSCDQALRFLTQHQQTARTDEDMVSDHVVGGGRGATNRNRAVESAEDRLKAAAEKLAAAEKELPVATKTRAKARWHKALEKITTGAYNDGRTHQFSALWKWRRLILTIMEDDRTKAKSSTSTSTVSVLLTRGWRPRPKLLSMLFQKHPDFSWCHPHSVVLQNIPKEVSQKELALAMQTAAQRAPLEEIEKEKVEIRLSKLTSKHKNKEKEIQDLEAKLKRINEKIEKLKLLDAEVKLPAVVKIRERKDAKGFWRAYILFHDKEDFTLAMSALGRTTGAPLKTTKTVPHIKALYNGAKEGLEQVEALYKVHPSEINKIRLRDARKESASASLGLRVVVQSSRGGVPEMSEDIRSSAGTNHAWVVAAKAVGPIRPEAPRHASTLCFSLDGTIDEANGDIYRQKAMIHRGKADMKRFQRSLTTQVSDKTAELSAFGILTALMDGEVDKTLCSICLGYLGEDDEDNEVASSQSAGRKRKKETATITMIKCSHMFCTRCINEYVHDAVSSHQDVSCPNCRQRFSQTDCILVDRHLKDEQEALRKERQAAQKIVRAASKIIEESNGQLGPEMWRSLFLSLPLPPSDIPNGGDPRFTAIPRDALAHLRCATGMKTNCGARGRPPPGSAKGSGRCSKIQRLLDDLPTNERCVIFSSNKECLMHLQAVFKAENIGFMSIYNGQSSSLSRRAVTTWESPGKQPTDPPPFPCLLVQAGAAAAGLTLTAASKMFLMEPFLKQEEEHQAYARCHRYSQKHRVSVKVYYTPVSVESRLLEWRKSGKKPLKTTDDVDADLCNFEKGTKVIVHDVDEDTDDECSVAESSTEGSANETEDDGHDIAQANFLLGLLG